MDSFLGTQVRVRVYHKMNLNRVQEGVGTQVVAAE